MPDANGNENALGLFSPGRCSAARPKETLVTHAYLCYNFRKHSQGQFHAVVQHPSAAIVHGEWGEMMETTVFLWLGLIILAVVLESVTSQLVSIWFVFGGVAGLIAEAFHVPAEGQVAIAVVVSMLCLFFTRPFLKKKLDIKKVSTNSDRYIGERALVTAAIDNLKSSGQVQVRGVVWTARSERDDLPVAEGTEVRILRIEGVKVIVRPLEEAE